MGRNPKKIKTGKNVFCCSFPASRRNIGVSAHTKTKKNITVLVLDVIATPNTIPHPHIKRKNGLSEWMDSEKHASDERENICLCLDNIL
jgi:hypothetical protein